MTNALTPTDRWRRFWYLQNVEVWLGPMAGRRRRAVLRELKGNLGEAAADVGMTRALADLGRPRVLAATYLDSEPEGRPRWVHGAVAAGVVVGVWLYATLFYTFGMLDALRATGTAVPARGSFLGTAVTATANQQELSAAFDGLPWLPLLVTALAFLLVSRAWKALPRRAAPRVPAAG
jgi:hypothetical protein